MKPAGNEQGRGARVIPPLPAPTGHQGARSQLQGMQRVIQSPGLQNAQGRWTEEYYQNYPPVQGYQDQGQFSQPLPPLMGNHPPQYQAYQGPPQQGPPPQGPPPQQQGSQPQLPRQAQYPLRDQKEEFNLYTNMQRNNRPWGYERGSGWNR